MIFQAKNRKFLSVGIGLFAAYIVIAVLVFSGETQGFDAMLAESINSFQSSALTALMVGASNYGREYFWTATVAIMLIFGNRNTKLLAIELAALLVAGIIAGEIAKSVAFRERPYAALGSSISLRVPPDTDSSFPSGHALIVSIGAFFVLSKFKSGLKSRVAAVLLALEAAIVCYSRVYVGAHYPLDVLGGILLGGTIVYLGVYFIETSFPRLFLRMANLFESFFEKMHVPELL